jgi:DNA-binding phage protein
MTLEQSQTAEATESQVHYSPEEAGEILRIAAHLQDNTITAEQLRAIAREAGVSDENLERAIQQYEQSRQAEGT